MKRKIVIIIIVLILVVFAVVLLVSQNKQEKTLRENLKNTGIMVEQSHNTIKLIIPDNITFDVDQASLKRDFLPILKSITLTLKKYDKDYIKIIGYTSNTGSSAYNLALSKRRAESVRNYFYAHGIKSERLSYTGYGEKYPITNNKTIAGRSANRRVEITIFRKKLSTQH